MTPTMAMALHHLVATVDLNAVQVVDQGKGADWTDAVCTARDELPEGTVAALEQLGTASDDALTLVNDCAAMLALAITSASILDLATNSVQRGFIDESLLHLGVIGDKLNKLKVLLGQNTKET